MESMNPTLQSCQPACLAVRDEFDPLDETSISAVSLDPLASTRGGAAMNTLATLLQRTP